MHKDALSLFEMERWSVHHHNSAAVEFYSSKQSLLQPHSVVSDSRFKDVRLLASMLYCGYRNGIRKYQWRIVKHKNAHAGLVTKWSA